MKREGSILIHDTHIGVWEDTEGHNREQIFREMEGVYAKLMTFMRRRGFAVARDEKIYKSSGHLGKRGDLEFAAHVSGRSIQLEFFQNVSIENQHGGRFDFQKLQRLAAVSRRLRLECLSLMWRIVRWLTGLGYHIEDQGEQLESSMRMVRDLAENTRPLTPLEKFNRDWRSHDFERDDTGWPSVRALRHWPSPLRQGQVKYARINGRLVRGQVFDGVNGTWYLYVNDKAVAYGHDGKFFDCANPDQEPRRYFKDLEPRMLKYIDAAIKQQDYLRAGKLSEALGRQLLEARR